MDNVIHQKCTGNALQKITDSSLEIKDEEVFSCSCKLGSSNELRGVFNSVEHDLLEDVHVDTLVQVTASRTVEFYCNDLESSVSRSDFGLMLIYAERAASTKNSVGFVLYSVYSAL